MRSAVPFFLLLVASTASRVAAQCPDPGVDLEVTVAPRVAQPGEMITVTVENVSTSCAYGLEGGFNCPFSAVHSGDCTGPTVFTQLCPAVFVSFDPGNVASRSWNQLDNSSQQVPPGVYAFRLNIWHPDLGFVAICPTVEILATCELPANYGSGGAGSGGFVPHLGSSGGFPQIGNDALQLTVSNALGGARAALFLGWAAASVPTAWGTLVVASDPPPVALFVHLAGPPGQPGAGSLRIPLPIPDDPTLVGVQAYAQVLIGDAQSTGGIAHTEGLTLTICQP